MEMTILTRIEATIEATKAFSTKKGACKMRIRVITLLVTATNMEVGIVGAGMDTVGWKRVGLDSNRGG